MIPLFLPHLLAQTTEPMIPGSFITGFVVAVLPAVAGAMVVWKRAEEKVKRQKLQLEDPVPELPVKRVYSPPSYHQHEALAARVSRVEVSVDQLRRDQQEQFGKLLQAGETRADRLAEKIDGVAVGFHRRVDQLLNHDPKQ